MKFYQTPITTGRKETICLMKVFFFRSLTRAIHECTRELTRTRTCEYFNSQTGTRTRANLFPRVTRTRESSTHKLQVHPPSLYQKWHINRLSDALGTFYVIYSLYIYISYAYISREHF